jgi:flagellar basal body rod protein FlgG
LYSLFNFYNVGTDYPGVKITPYTSSTGTLFDVNRLTNNIQAGNLSSGTIKIGGENLELYSDNEIKLLFDAGNATITNNELNFTISKSKTSQITLKYGLTLSYTADDIELHYVNSDKVLISHGMQFKDDGGLIIKSSKNINDIKITYGMQFEDEGANLIIIKPGNSSYGIKLPWTRL